MTRVQDWMRALAGALMLAACSEEPDFGMDCTEIGCVDGFLVEFTPNAGWPAGNYEFALALDGFAGFQINPPNPTEVDLTIARDDSVLVERSWNPTYETSQPNGPGCEPTCVSARDEVTVPLGP